MLLFIARTFGLFFLAIALVSAVIDTSRSIAASKPVITAFGATWKALAPASLSAAKTVIEQNLNPFFWDPVMLWLLSWPTWAIFGFLAFAIFALGRRRRKTRFGRLAQR